jgi:phosphatidylinositol alpha-mannosyltransferase
VDTELYARGRPLAHLDDGIPKLLFVGRLDPRNRLDLLLRAFAEVRRRLGRARLVVVGDGPLRAEYASLVDPELRADVLFEGQVTGGQPDYYASADVFCFPASIASMPMTVVEAMAARRPVVAFDIDGIREVLSDGAQGLIVPDGDAHAFAAALIGLLGDARRRATIGQAAQVAVQRYAWARLVVEVERFYEQALRRAARARR